MATVSGIGGIILRARDPQHLQNWYAQHLGIQVDGDGVWSHHWRDLANPNHVARTIWEVFGEDADNFKPSASSFMVNYRVDDLDQMLSDLRAAGVTVLEETVTFPSGRLGWCLDPEGNKVEFWEAANEPGQQPR